MKRTFKLLILLFLCNYCTAVFSQNKRKATVNIENLKVEAQVGWTVTDQPLIRLSWDVEVLSNKKNIKGYEIIIAKNYKDAKNGIGSIWKSNLLPVENGKWTTFDASNQASRTENWWRVRTVFSDKSNGEWSQIALFEMGLKSNTDWIGKWIGMNIKNRKRSAPLFRKVFSVEKSIAKARLYVCGQGYHESWINGKRLGNEVLQPAQTDYNLRNFYISHDITQQLKKGENAIGFWVGDGFFNQDKVWKPKGFSYGEPRVIAQIEITHKDGSKVVIKTDETWQCLPSAVIESNIYAGEKYDAKLYNDNWATTESKNWQNVEILSSPGGKFVAQELQPCRILATVNVKKISELRPNTWIFDFGQNMVGWAKLKVNATPGTVINMRFGEDILPSGELNFASSGVAHTKVIQTDIYTCKGNGEEFWEPRFTYHGFRFAEITVSNGQLINKVPTKEMLVGQVIYTDMEIVGDFSSSDTTLNKAFDWAHWTQIGNVQGVPTDCPVRERCGWTGDAHNITPYTLYRFDAAIMWNKYVRDIETSARISAPMLRFGKGFGERTMLVKKKGIPTMVAPGKRFIGEASPDWGSALPFIPWDVYVRTGDTRSLFEQYPSIKLWAEHLQELSTDGIIFSGMGDWCKPIYENNTSKPDRELYGTVSPMLSTACYYRSVRITADAAKLMKNDKDFQYFDSLANTIRIAYTKAFYSENKILIPDQTINAISIAWNILAPEFHEGVAKVLAQQVKDAGYHFMTGVFGMPSLWPTLCKFGYQDVAWKTLQIESAPSLRYLAKRNATTFWEVWPYEKDEKTEYSRSMNHPFQAGFVAWFFEGLAGISPDINAPGYRLIHLEPQLIDGLDWVKCRFKSPMGMIESSWKRTENELVWTVEIPIGASAKLRVPGKISEIEGAPVHIISNAINVSDAMGNAQRISLETGKYKISSIINQISK